MEDYKKLLTDLYKVHDPERIKQIDYFLERYKGKERQFFISQKSKYKSKKLVSDSKKIIEEALERIKSQSEEKKTETIETTDENKDKPKDIKKIIVPLVEVKSEKKAEIEPEKEAEKTPESITIEPSKTADEKKETLIAIVNPPVTSNSVSKKPLPEKDRNKRKNYLLYLLGIVVLVILLALLAFYFFFYAPNNKEEESAKKPQTTITKEQAKPEVQTPDAKPIQQNVAPVSSLRIEKGNLKLPAHFVACYAVKNEKFAIQKANELKAKGFDASYYWIPDFVPQGHTYFKVVIGPFETRTDAMKKLTPVQERAEFDAYVLELK